MNCETALEFQAVLGEGPVWDPETQCLFFIDIVGESVHRWNPGSGEVQSWDVPGQIGCMALRNPREAILALADGFYTFDFGSGKATQRVNPNADRPQNRFNDGKCDRNGRFWAGSMHADGNRLTGSLYRYDGVNQPESVIDGIGIPNGIGWSPDEKAFYFTDSVRHRIYVYDYEAGTGDISNQRVFATQPDGQPDGLTVDNDGFIWSAVWDGAKVVRYASDGRIDREIAIPALRPTSCMFGGPNLTDLYVTSARIGLTPQQLEEYPLSGSVFVIRTHVSGIPEPRFSG